MTNTVTRSENGPKQTLRVYGPNEAVLVRLGQLFWLILVAGMGETTIPYGNPDCGVPADPEAA